MELLEAMASRAYRHGLEPEENASTENPRHPTHRCPVGARVADLADHGFSDVNPMPWAGELYADSSDGRTLYRLYFIEERAQWASLTETIVGAGVGSKPVAEDTGWSSAAQTADIHRAMQAGTLSCRNVQRVWRRWNST
jgi:hypothetical protein